MIKRLLCIAVFLLTGCQKSFFSENFSGSACPQVQILRNDSYLNQYMNGKETFQINIEGYEGFCYFDEYAERHRAVIRPIFRIKRLRSSDETDVRFSYYTETVKGPPEFLGKKTYYLDVSIARAEREKIYKAPEVSVFIPSEAVYDYDINLGLWLSPKERQYNQRTFDINYRYIEE